MEVIMLRDKAISQDERGFLCITDLWNLAGAPDSKQPKYWRRLPTVRELISALLSNVRYSHL